MVPTEFIRGTEGANRAPNANYAAKGTLRKVIYPTGGFEEFEYEPHTLSEYGNDSSFLSSTLYGYGVTNPTTPTVKTNTFLTNSIGNTRITVSAAQNPAGPFPGQSGFWYPQDAHRLVEFNIQRISDNVYVFGGWIKVYETQTFNLALDPNTAYRINLSVYGKSTYGQIDVLFNPTVILRWFNRPVCGLRVNSINSFDPVTNKTQKKYYTYAAMSDLTKSTGQGSSIIDYTAVYPGGAQCGYQATCQGFMEQILCLKLRQFSSSSISGSFTFGGSPIAYTNVIESDDPGFANGCTEHRYNAVYGQFPANAVVGELMPGCPQELSADMNGMEKETKWFKRIAGQNILVKHQENNYNYDGRVYNEISNFVSRKKWDPYPLSNTGIDMETRLKPFDLGYYKFTSRWVYLQNTVTTEYDETGANPMVSTTNYEYNNVDHTLATKTSTTGSNGEAIEQQTKYPADYYTVPYTTMVSKHILAPVVESKSLRAGTTVSTVKSDYADWFSDGTVIKPQLVKLAKGAAAPETRLHYFSFEAGGNPLEVAKEDGMHIAYIWDYLKAFPIAEVKNAAPADIAYSGFENADNRGNWTVLGTELPAGSSDLTTYWKVYENDAITGKRSFGGRLTKTVSAAQSYTVTMWSKSGTPTVNGLPCTFVQTKGSWSLYKKDISSAGTVTVQGTQMDDVRLHPAKAQMTTYTYLPYVGISSVTDAANNIQSYEYDGLNRLLIVRDIDKNILKQYEYKYNQSIAPCGNTIPDWQYTGTTQCIMDANNTYTGQMKKELRDENNCSSTYLQTQWETVTAPAGQCVAQITCTGANMHLVNGVCEPGTLVLVSSVRGPNGWICTFRYVWSDGYEGPVFSEIHPKTCLLLSE